MCSPVRGFRGGSELAFLLQLRRLPPGVARFQWRARRLASRVGDDFSKAAATRPDKLAALLDMARGRRHVVELGTASAWTAISLLLADRDRELVGYDPFARAERDLYLKLISREVLGRLTLVTATGAEGPRTDRPVDLLYVDSSHGRADTIQEVCVWRPVLRRDSLIVFDDYDHPEFPGVREAIEELGLHGTERDGFYVHRVPA